MVFKRQLSYYVITIYIPTFLIVAVSWMSFFLDHKSVIEPNILMELKRYTSFTNIITILFCKCFTEACYVLCLHKPTMTNHEIWGIYTNIGIVKPKDMSKQCFHLSVISLNYESTADNINNILKIFLSFHPSNLYEHESILAFESSFFSSSMSVAFGEHLLVIRIPESVLLEQIELFLSSSNNRWEFFHKCI